VVTAITAQNSREVTGVWPVPAEQIAAQLEAVGSDLRLHAVKIGMLGGAAAVEAVVRFLVRYRPPNVVLDPVLASTGGVPLLDQEGRARMMDYLLPQVDLVTPNLIEAAALTGLHVGDDAGMEKAAHWLLGRGARAALVKGGHRDDAPRDLLLVAGQPAVWIDGRRIRWDLVSSPVETGGSGVHGTGCVLAAAIAARLARGRDLVTAVREGKRFVEATIEGAVTRGQGRPNVEPMAAAGLFAPDAEERHAARLARVRGVYVVTDSRLRSDRDATAAVEAAIAGGAGVVQLREKGMTTPKLVALARSLAARARSAGVLFIVNDRVDVALAAGADGAHVGPDDMPPADARRLLGPERLLGVSVGTVAEAQAAAPNASYFGVGPIFGTRTKSDAGDAVTPARIREIRAAAPGIPIVAIGGISRENIGEIAAAGAEAAAVVSAVVAAPDMAAAVRELLERFRQKPSQAT
jgi:thiamine-phosphate diphosphorylase/hydroxymethylpyrimidine kinase/phosphomethylpyrimidine kinase